MSAKKDPGSDRSATSDYQPQTRLIPNEDHPDYVSGTIGEGTSASEALTPVPDGPPQPPLPMPLPYPLPLPLPQPMPVPVPRPLPGPIPTPWPISFCSPVSGRYTYAGPVLAVPETPAWIPILPRRLLSVTVRVDVDRFFPQNRISIEASRLIPRAEAHAIAEVTSDDCLGYNRRRIVARIVYRHGSRGLIPGDEVVFEAKRGRGFGYGSYTLTLSGAGTKPITFALASQSHYFDPVEFEVDRVENAGTPVTTYDIGSHANRPADLPLETISLATVYERAGFQVTMSPNITEIPVADAGANGTWSDNEMHNAMVAYWSRFADRPQWAMWVLFAAQHDTGYSLGGVMFDDIGPNHRQGTSIFTNSFIQDAPQADANPAAWRQRMVFWTAIHEMGHAFNLAHSWQKALGDPWIPLANQPEARSFMNYPFRVTGGEAAFFSDFRFRFTDEELLFMRHAPRRFVQMGNANWFVDHAFENPKDLAKTRCWELRIRPNREVNAYRFLEPVELELKLTNASAERAAVDEHTLSDGRHIAVFVRREGAQARQWRPMITRCSKQQTKDLKSGESIYGAHMVSGSTEGWLIDEPGFYAVQAAVDVGNEVVVSNVLRLYVGPPVTAEESRLAPDYFTEEVARALVFQGALALPGAMETLRKVVERCSENPAALHASVALSTPMLLDYKWLDISADRAGIALRSVSADIDAAAEAQMAALMTAPDRAAETMGHIDYFRTLDHLAEALAKAGNEKGAKQVTQASVETMKKRAILPSVVQAAERKLTRMK